jgi:hypothetical protein
VAEPEMDYWKKEGFKPREVRDGIVNLTKGMVSYC